jgi:subtilisin family serine protease
MKTAWALFVALALICTGLSSASAIEARAEASPSPGERATGTLSDTFEPKSPDETIQVFIQLDEPSVAAVAAKGVGVPAQKAHGRDVLAQQDQAREQLGSLIVHELSNMVVGANGFRAFVRASDIPVIEATAGVKTVAPVTRHYLSNATSVPWIGGDTAHDAGFTGEGVSIAIIDTGIDYTHASFGGAGTSGAYDANNPNIIEPSSFPTSKVVGGHDFAGPTYDPSSEDTSDPDPDGDPLDVHGHGTHVAGSAAGIDGVNPPGVAPDADLYALKVFGDVAGSTDLVSDAIEFALDPNGDLSTDDHVDVINMSLGSPYGHPDDPSAIAAANAVDLGVVVVAAAGNEGTPSYIAGSPAVAEGVISVAASIDGSDGIATFSSRGPGFGNVFKPSLSAPGFQILSAGVGTGASLVQSSGTSMASPHVAGAAALVLEAYPSLAPEEVQALLMNTTSPATPGGTVPLTDQGTGVVRVDRATIDAQGFAAPAGIIFRLNPTTSTTQSAVVDITRLAGDATYDVAIASNTSLAGVSWSASASTVTTSGGSGSIQVSVTATPGAMAVDDGYLSQSESDGWLVLTNQTDSSDEIVVGLVAVADPASRVTATAGFNSVTVSNAGPSTGYAEGFTKIYDGSGFIDSLGYRTETVTDSFGTYDRIDFGVALGTAWSAPGANEIYIYIDVDQNGTDDWLIMAADYGLVTGTPLTGEVVTALFELDGPVAWLLYYGLADFNDGVMVLPADLNGDFGFLADGDNTPFDVTAVAFDQLGLAGVSDTVTINPATELTAASLMSHTLTASGSVPIAIDGTGQMLWLFPNNQISAQSATVTVTSPPAAPNDLNDEMFFYRDDGLFRFYNVNPNGTLPKALLEGDSYTTGWDSITAIDLDGP